MFNSIFRFLISAPARYLYLVLVAWGCLFYYRDHDFFKTPTEPSLIGEASDLPPVGILLVNDHQMQESLSGYDSVEAQHLAVILESAHTLGIETLGLSSPFEWGSHEQNISLQILARSLRHFPQQAIGLRLMAGSSSSFVPAELEPWLIPMQNIQGKVQELPLVNRCIEEWSSRVERHQISPHWAPDWILGQEQLKDKEPLLIRWQDDIYPSLPLMLAMQLKGLKSADLQVKLGEYIKLGNAYIPIDTAANLSLKIDTTHQLQLPELLDSKAQLPLGCKSLLIDHAPAHPQGTTAIKKKAQALATLLAQYKLASGTACTEHHELVFMMMSGIILMIIIALTLSIKQAIYRVIWLMLSVALLCATQAAVWEAGIEAKSIILLATFIMLFACLYAANSNENT